MDSHFVEPVSLHGSRCCRASKTQNAKQTDRYHEKQTLFVCFPAKPKIQAAPSLLKALIGQTVVLPCVVQGEPSPEISWFHDGSPVWAKDTAALKIHRASLTDQGIYSCVAKNTAGQDTMEVKLEVLGGSLT